MGNDLIFEYKVFFFAIAKHALRQNANWFCHYSLQIIEFDIWIANTQNLKVKIENEMSEILNSDWHNTINKFLWLFFHMVRLN